MVSSVGTYTASTAIHPGTLQSWEVKVKGSSFLLDLLNLLNLLNQLNLRSQSRSFGFCTKAQVPSLAFKLLDVRSPAKACDLQKWYYKNGKLMAQKWHSRHSDSDMGFTAVPWVLFVVCCFHSGSLRLVLLSDLLFPLLFLLFFCLFFFVCLFLLSCLAPCPLQLVSHTVSFYFLPFLRF